MKPTDTASPVIANGNTVTVTRTGFAIGERGDGTEFDVGVGSQWEVSEVDRVSGYVRHALLTNDNGDTVSLSGPSKSLGTYVSHNTGETA